MSWLFDSGHAVDVVLTVIAIEFAWLVARGRDAVTVALTLVPGALMLLALRAAIAGLDWYWIALPLTASLPVHLADLRRRKLI
jgi:hypothetical protein